MKSFTVTSEMAGLGSKQMPKRILLFVVCIAAAEIIGFWWNAHRGEHPKLSSFVSSGFVGIVTALLTDLWERQRKFPYTLVVSDDCIRVVYPSGEKSLRKDEIKSVTETEGGTFRVPGLRISKYGRLGTWFWGCITIPKALPEYESLRSLALSWRHTASA
jgi:hypothetical protein